MKRRPHPLRLMACALCALAPALAHAEPEAGQIYVHTSRPGATVSAAKGGAAKPLARGETFTASGQVVNVASGQPLALVFSNGVAAYLPSGGRLTLGEFLQEPVDNTAKDREYEPSRSQMSLDLAQGELVLSGRKMIPTSTLTLTTPLANFACRAQSLIATVTNDSVTLTLLDGTAEITIPETGFKETLQANQTATLSRKDLHEAYPLKLANLSSDSALRAQVKDLTTSARWAENRVDFARVGNQLRAQLVIPLEFTQHTSIDETRFR